MKVEPVREFAPKSIRRPLARTTRSALRRREVLTALLLVLHFDNQKPLSCIAGICNFVPRDGLAEDIGISAHLQVPSAARALHLQISSTQRIDKAGRMLVTYMLPSGRERATQMRIWSSS